MRRRLPWILAFIHAAWLVIGVARLPFQPHPEQPRPAEFSFSSWHMGTSIMVAGRDLHHDHVTWPLMIIDMPVIALLVVPELLFPRAMSPMTASYVYGAAWLVLGSAWWYLLGRLIAPRTLEPDREATVRRKSNV